MKKTILLLGMAALFAGCSQSNTENAKIDALNQKIDLLAQNQATVISNEFVLAKGIDLVRCQLTNVPDINQLNELQGRFDKLDDANQVTHEAQKWIMNMQIEMATNKVFSP